MAYVFPLLVLTISVISKLNGEGHNIFTHLVPRFAIVMFTIIPAVISGYESKQKAMLSMLMGILVYILYDYVHAWFGIDYKSFSNSVSFYPILVLVIGVVTLGILLLIFFMHGTNNVYEHLVMAQKKELLEQNTEIIAQRDEIEAQRDEIVSQKHLIEKKNHDLTASIVYAQRIQKAILPKTEILSSVFPEHFIFYRPRDIVSGDFYWVKKIDDQLFVLAADCTGHGVPGAFMSMLGISSLNEIVRHESRLKAADVLDKLRVYVKDALQQSGNMGEQQDGMDVALCIFDLNEASLQFAGAYNPLYIIRADQLIEIKSDHMPIGVHPKDNVPFTNHVVSLEKGDVLYIFSDGYHSQIGNGDKNEKFKTYRLKDLVLKMHNYPMNVQMQMLEEEMQLWQGNKQQVDDMLIIGIKY